MSLKVCNKLWLISDTHFGHKNIVKFQQRPESHEVIMLDAWIRRVAEDDQILCQGDVFMGKQGNPEKWARVISRLPGEKFLILGNHDRKNQAGRADDIYTEIAGFTVINPFVHEGFAFTHRPIAEDFPYLGLSPKEFLGLEVPFDPPAIHDWHTNIHGHTHGNLFEPGDLYNGVGFWDKRYINVCVEHTNLAPVQLGNVWSR